MTHACSRPTSLPTSSMAWPGTPDDREIIFGGNQLRRVSVSKGESSITNIPTSLAQRRFRRCVATACVRTVRRQCDVRKLDLHDLTHVAGEPSELISSTRQQAAPSFSLTARASPSSPIAAELGIWDSCDRDGSNAVQLTRFGVGLDGTPRWSPDGRQIVFDHGPMECRRCTWFPPVASRARSPATRRAAKCHLLARRKMGLSSTPRITTV